MTPPISIWLYVGSCRWRRSMQIFARPRPRLACDYSACELTSCFVLSLRPRMRPQPGNNGLIHFGSHLAEWKLAQRRLAEDIVDVQHRQAVHGAPSIGRERPGIATGK